MRSARRVVWGIMQIHVTEEAVMITELSDEDMQHLLHLLRGSAGRSLVIPFTRHSATPTSWQR